MECASPPPRLPCGMCGEGFPSPEEHSLPHPQLPPHGRAVCAWLPPCFRSGGDVLGQRRQAVCVQPLAPELRQKSTAGRGRLSHGRISSCPVGTSASLAVGKPSSGELWTLLPVPSSEKAELGSRRDRQGSRHPNPDKVTRGPLHLTANGGAGARALAGCVHVCGFVLKDTILRTPLSSPPGDEESLLTLRTRRWPSAPSPRAPHPGQVSPLPRLPPGQNPQQARNPSPEVSCCDLWPLIPTCSELRPVAPARRGEYSRRSQAGLRAQSVPQTLDRGLLSSGLRAPPREAPVAITLSQGVEPPGVWGRIRVTQQVVGSWGLWLQAG